MLFAQSRLAHGCLSFLGFEIVAQLGHLAFLVAKHLAGFGAFLQNSHLLFVVVLGNHGLQAFNLLLFIDNALLRLLLLAFDGEFELGSFHLCQFAQLLLQPGDGALLF